MLERGGYEVVQVDECLFNADAWNNKCWALCRQPILKISRFNSSKKIVVCGAISSCTGAVHFKYGYRSFKAPDLVEMLQQIRASVGKRKKVAVFWDNATCHRANIVTQEAKKLKIELVKNLSYRPDLNGIELAWKTAKEMYRSSIDRHKAMNTTWDQLGLVEHIIQNIPDQRFKDCATEGRRRIHTGKPIRHIEGAEPVPQLTAIQAVQLP